MKKQISSGAEKAEKLTRDKNAANGEKKTTKKSGGAAVKSTTNTAAKSTANTTEKKRSSHNTAAPIEQKSAKKRAVKSTADKRAKRKQARAEKKLEAAKIRAEKKQKRLEKKLNAKQRRLDRIAAYKEKMAEKRERRRERRDALKHETKEARLERKQEEKQAKIEARVAKREAHVQAVKAKREHRLKVRAEKRANRRERRHAPGFGGWLAAVISLGVTTLALGTMLTFGWLSFNGMQADVAGVHTQSLYELNSIVDNLDGNLSKARVSNSADEQVRLLSDIAIESQMAEVILERLPVDVAITQNLTNYVNKIGDSAQSMLYSVARGERLTDSQRATIRFMYDRNLELKKALNELIANTTEKDLLNAMRGKGFSSLTQSFTELDNNTVETPKEIHDGPFADNVKPTSAKFLENLEEIDAPRAEELAKSYFADYKPTDVRCTGEAIAQQISCYNVVLSTDDGEMLAQLSKKGGKVVMFDSYKDCSDKNFSVERCITIARDFLSSLGYDDLKAVWSSENGTTCNLNFVYENDGVVYYPDMIKVKVCEQRGVVTGMEGIAYLLNHTERKAASPEISRADAKANLAEGFEVSSSRLSVIPTDDGEALAYEFIGRYDGSTYYIYVDAMSGAEDQVFTVIGTAQGRALL